MRALHNVVVLACAAAVMAGAAPAFAQAQPQDDLQPGVNTSALPAQTHPAAQATPEASTASPASAASSPGKTAAGKPASGKPAPGGKKAMDRIDLDTTQITGNKELPKVMYVVPWKHSDLGDLTGKPANSLVDEILQPLDRDVFNREERYYHTVAPQKGPAAAPAGAAGEH
jgi:hypothetical protein